MPPKKNMTAEEFEMKLRSDITKKGAEWMNYNKQNFIWSFKVPGL
jgi:hypothetical protein